MNDYLENVSWTEQISSDTSVDCDINNIYNTLLTASEKFIPVRKSTNYKKYLVTGENCLEGANYLKRDYW